MAIAMNIINFLFTLQEACSLVGVRVLPKKKMVAKLEEIYNYTHPLVGM